MKCKHQGKRFLRRWIPIEPGIVPKSITGETDICADCGAWLSLGPSNDDIPNREVWLAEQLAIYRRNPGLYNGMREYMTGVAVDLASEML